VSGALGVVDLLLLGLATRAMSSCGIAPPPWLLGEAGTFLECFGLAAFRDCECGRAFGIYGICFVAYLHHRDVNCGQLRRMSERQSVYIHFPAESHRVKAN